MLFILAFVLLIIGVSFALKIETETGYYECQKCHNKYVPKYSKVYFAMHFGTTRYMKCPKCNEKSWQRKVLVNKKLQVIEIIIRAHRLLFFCFKSVHSQTFSY